MVISTSPVKPPVRSISTGKFVVEFGATIAVPGARSVNAPPLGASDEGPPSGARARTAAPQEAHAARPRRHRVDCRLRLSWSYGSPRSEEE